MSLFAIIAMHYSNIAQPYLIASEKSCQQTWPSTVKYLVSWIVYEYNFYEQAKNGFSVLVTIRLVF